MPHIAYTTNCVVIGTIMLMLWMCYGSIMSKWEFLRFHAIISQQLGKIQIIFSTSMHHSSLSYHMLSVALKDQRSTSRPRAILKTIFRLTVMSARMVNFYRVFEIYKTRFYLMRCIRKRDNHTAFSHYTQYVKIAV